MATLEDVVAKRNSGYDAIWSIAQGALSDLKASSRNSANAVLKEIENLNFDPGAPTPLVIDASLNINGIMSQIDNYISKLSSISMGALPDTPSQTMLNYEVWSDPFASQIKASLSSYLTSMGIPDVTYQNAIFNEEYERNLQTLNDMYDLADAKTGARGFTYTNAYGNMLKADAQQKYQFDRTQISRTISKTVTEWARQNYQFSIEKGISYEQIQMDFTYKYCTAFVEIYKSLVMAVLEKYRADITTITAPVTALIQKLQAALEYTKTKADLDKTNETLKQTRSQIEISEALQKYQADISRINNEFSGQLEQVRASAAHAAGLANATATSVIGLVKQ